MCHLSPAIFGMWSICSVLFSAFCVYHLWHYDRFRCLRFDRGPYSGAFKRIMTYSYLLAQPLIATYSVGNAVIKYKEGFIFNPQYGVIPKPRSEWTKVHQDAMFPLIMLLAVCFSLEMVIHLEELCFWVFLMTATALSQNWFTSIYFLVWSCGSVIALIIVPVASVLSRSDPLKNEAYTFLAGASGNLTLTLCFVPILFLFPAFLRKLVQQGVEKATMIRLQKLHELNRLRFFFKLLFVVPLIPFEIEALGPHGHHNSGTMFLTEILGMVSAFGCIISSAITLLIFFPRNGESEYETSNLGRLSRLEKSERNLKVERYGQNVLGSHYERNRFVYSPDISVGSSPNPPGHVSYSINFSSRSQTEDGHGPPPRYQAPNVGNIEPGYYGDRIIEVVPPLPSIRGTTLRPNRLCPDGNVELGGVRDLPVTGTWVKDWASQFRSPLDVMQ